MEHTDLDIYIPIDKTKSAFEEHLRLPNNNRILFSGKFGSGKTTFLKRFYEEKKNVNVFHLFPVNYQVADNKDIFDLIKFDILTILVENDLVLKDEDIGRFLSLQSYIMSDGAYAIWGFLKELPKLGKVFKSSEKLVDFFSGFNKYQEELNAAKENTIQKYLEGIKQKKGNIYDADYITSLIRISIQNQKSANKENILIIDDLDRMDPAHIFRIMNIFSAHFDQMNQLEQEDRTDNKFGFDRIIMVCDIDNIRNLFNSFYGSDADFGGYIDKFFSMRIFPFSLKNAIIEKIEDFFIPCRSNNPERGGSKDQLIGFIRPLISDFIDIEALNFRIIKNIRLGERNFRQPYTLPNFELGNIRSYRIVYVQVLDFLYNVFGCDFSKLHFAIKKSQELQKSLMKKKKDRCFTYFMPLLLDTINLDKIKGVKWRHPIKNFSIEFDLSENELETLQADMTKEVAFDMSQMNFYELLELALLNMKKQGCFHNTLE